MLLPRSYRRWATLAYLNTLVFTQLRVVRVLAYTELFLRSPEIQLASCHLFIHEEHAPSSDTYITIDGMKVRWAFII